jgi:hypothetical protein
MKTNLNRALTQAWTNQGGWRGNEKKFYSKSSKKARKGQPRTLGGQNSHPGTEKDREQGRIVFSRGQEKKK